MSRLGKKPIVVPKGIQVQISNGSVRVEGPKGNLQYEPSSRISLDWQESERLLFVNRQGDTRNDRAQHGLAWALLSNMVKGTATGYSKTLDIAGVGYNAKVQGQNLEMSIGFSHPVVMPIPVGVTVECPRPIQIVISGADKQLVGQFAANVRRVRPPEPYNGKGIKYADEVIRRKAGKAFVGGGG